MSEEANKKDDVLQEETVDGAQAPENEQAPENDQTPENDQAREQTQEPEGADKGGEAAGDANASDAADTAEAEEEALNARYLRLMADFQNFKRRTEKEKNDIYAFANEKIISELLNVIDNFERALAAGNADDSFYKGMEMILKQLQGVLDKAGASEIKALGEDFDPNFHSAVMTEDSTEYESGKVTEVLQKGYILNNKVIRPAMVKVAN